MDNLVLDRIKLRKRAIESCFALTLKEGFDDQKITFHILNKFPTLVEGMNDDEIYDYCLTITSIIEERLQQYDYQHGNTYIE